jgi:hypothetical protein
MLHRTGSCSHQPTAVCDMLGVGPSLATATTLSVIVLKPAGPSLVSHPQLQANMRRDAMFAMMAVSVSQSPQHLCYGTQACRSVPVAAFISAGHDAARGHVC